MRWAFEHANEYVNVIRDALNSPALDTIPPGININVIGLPVASLAQKLPTTENRNPPALTLQALQEDFGKKLGKFIDSKGGEFTKDRLVGINDQPEFDFGKNLERIKNLGNDDNGWKEAGQLHNAFLLWERAVSNKVHDVLYGDVKRRQALKAFVWGGLSGQSKPDQRGKK